MRRAQFNAALLLGLVAAGVTAAPALAGETGRIVAVNVEGRSLNLVLQTDGLAEGVTVDPASIVVEIDGRRTAATVQRVASGSSVVERTAVLAIDNSRSMAGALFAAAKSAATAFLDQVPDDVSVGLVTFGDTASVAVPASAGRDDVRAAIEDLALDDTVGTALFDAAALAADETGSKGARSVLILTDGNEDGSSRVGLREAIEHATDDGVTVDAVYIGGDAEQPPELKQLIDGAGGQVVTSATTDLGGVFEQAAEAISNQLFITAELPAQTARSGTVVVVARAGGVTITDSAFATFAAPGSNTAPPTYGPRPVERGTATPLLTKATLPVILGSLFVGLLVLVFVAMSNIKRDEKQGRVRRRLSIYTLTGRAPVKHEETTTALGDSQIARSAVELAGKVVTKRDFETGLARKLEAAGVPLRAAEWMLIHIGVAIGAALLALLVSGGQVLPTVLGLGLGLVLPFAYLVVKESRRTSAFLAQLPDTLQLMAGGLSGGYSMPQAMDTVVREGSQPVSGEFNRALVEARLGVPIEDAMDGIGERMQSKDFAWVVMAIRIQREVGGNLAELLTTVSATLRERERLRRQVQVLSAEGRLSAWILGLLPIVFTLYLSLAQPAYLKPLITEPLGWVMIATGLILLAVGSMWLRKVVKVEV